MAAVIECARRILTRFQVYGVLGDTNGDDGKPLIGGTSLSLATKSFGEHMNGNNGHSPNDVFSAASSRSWRKKADWDAKNFDGLGTSIKSVGDRLAKML